MPLVQPGARAPTDLNGTTDDNNNKVEYQLVKRLKDRCRRIYNHVSFLGTGIYLSMSRRTYLRCRLRPRGSLSSAARRCHTTLSYLLVGLS